MAITVQSTSNTPFSGSNVQTLTVNKPSGVVDGDLMIAQIMSSNENGNYTAPTDWTLIRSTLNSDFASNLYYKVAGASEPSDYTWDLQAGTTNSHQGAGVIYRITGYEFPLSILDSGNSVQNQASPYGAAIGLTPVAADSLILLFFSGSVQAVTFSSPSIATSNPSWSTAYTSSNASGNAFGVASFYAVRPETTATGAPSISGWAGTIDASMQMLIVTTDIFIEFDATPDALPFNISNPLVLQPRTFHIDQTDPSITHRDITVSWTDEEKNTAIWTDNEKLL